MEGNIYTNKHTKQTLKPRHTHKHKIHMGEHSFESKFLEHNKHTATLQTLDLSSTCVSRVELQPDLFAMVLACKLGLGKAWVVVLLLCSLAAAPWSNVKSFRGKLWRQHGRTRY